MGADCIISGIRPQIAQTIVHLGVDLHGVVTKANLADALALAMRRTGISVLRTGHAATGSGGAPIEGPAASGNGSAGGGSHVRAAIPRRRIEA